MQAVLISVLRPRAGSVLQTPHLPYRITEYYLPPDTGELVPGLYTVSQKNRTPATFCNNSNSPDSIAIDFDKNNR